MTPLDRLLTELRDLPPEERLPVWVLRKVHELGEISEPPTVAPPEWLQGKVVESLQAVTRGWPQDDFFSAVRTLERLGLVEVEHDDTYVLAMVSCLGNRWDGAVRPAALRRDPGLRDMVWRVFEVEGGGEVSLANVDKFSRPEAGWAQTFQTLVADGTLPRDRVLENCLRALGRDFSAYRAGWFAQLYRSLEPTAAESAAYQPLLLRLLRSAVPATVSFAVGRLAAVAKAGGLDDEGYVARCDAAMVVPAKSTAAAAVKLAAAVARRRPDLGPAVANAVGGALGHSHRDVQAQALEVLKTLAAKDIVAARLDELEPSVRRTASQWLGVAVANDHETGPTTMVHPIWTEVPEQDTTVEELGARLLAGHLAAADVERFLAALAVKDTAGLEALRKQATRTLSDPGWARALRRGVAALVAGASGEVPAAAALPDMFLVRRLGEVLDVVTGRRAPAQLLATPTEPAGWLDPAVFVARLAANPDPPMFDFAAALLRLAPDGRAEALRSARTLPGETGAVARYALGGEPGQITSRAWWVAAARSRAPLADDPHLVAAGLDAAGAGRAAAHSLRLTPFQYRVQDKDKARMRTAYTPHLEVVPPGARNRADQPTVVGAWDQRGNDNPWWHLDPDWIEWHAQIWPHDAESFFAVRIDEVLTTADVLPTVSYGTSTILDVLLTHPGRLGPMAAATLAAGLSTTEVQHRVLASEALVRLVPAGRITAPELADAMTLLAGHCVATRWAATLRDAARTGPDPAAAVVEVMDHLLPQLDADHPGLHALLETRYELAVQLGSIALRPPLQAWLRELRGGSKSARTARLILAEASPGGAR